MNNEKIAYHVSIVTIIGNILLSGLKLFAGIFSHSQAMLSDAVHSLSDVFSSIVVIIGVRISSKSADESHPYGHDRFECVASLLLSIMLFATGIGIGYVGIKSIISGNIVATPGILALISAVISIVVKEGMYLYTIKAAKKINSDALKADAWHHRSDALSSIGSMIGIIGARMGYTYLDSIASIIICLFIFKVSFDIFKSSIDKMVDKSCDIDTINEIKTIVSSNKDVIKIDELKTRQFGSTAYVDIDISVDKDLSLEKAHDIAEKLHDDIENKLIFVKHCMVHVNPYKKKKIAR